MQHRCLAWLKRDKANTITPFDWGRNRKGEETESNIYGATPPDAISVGKQGATFLSVVHPHDKNMIPTHTGTHQTPAMPKRSNLAIFQNSGHKPGSSMPLLEMHR